VIDYAEGMVAEIRLVGEAIGRRLKVSHIHWGGGTPSLLPTESLRAVVAALRVAEGLASGFVVAILPDNVMKSLGEPGWSEEER